MKISNSKKQLAKIISENGGWREGAEFSAQDGDGTGSIDFFKSKPHYCAGDKYWRGEYELAERIGKSDVTIKNYHQTILSRYEYFHLYPATDAVVEEPEHVWTNPPTIEQLAAEYRSRKDYAERKQQEADYANAEAEAKLAELVAAGKALGLVLSVAAPEPELVITDLRDLRVGDEVEANYRGIERVVGSVLKIDIGDKNQPVFVSDGKKSVWATEWKFIRRPSKEADNA